jgi:malonyl-CoA O-methyltransferase
MIMVDRYIKKQFNKAHSTYDKSCHLQDRINSDLLRNLCHYKASHFNIITDLGCGTGNSTYALKKRFNYQTLYALDIADRLLHIAQEKHTRTTINFIQHSFNEPFPATLQLLDLAYSNMSFQWAIVLHKTLQYIYDILAFKGLLTFSLPVLGTLEEMHAPYRHRFLPFETIQSYLNNLGFQSICAHQKTYIEKFHSPIEALRSLKNIGANILVNKNACKGLLSLQRLIQTVFKEKNTQTLTYQIGFFIAQK